MMNYRITEPSILKKDFKKDQERRLIAENKSAHLTKWIDCDLLKLDQHEALAYLRENYQEGTISYHKRLQIITNFDFYLTKYSRDRKDNRFHSIFTRMPSDLKRFVRFDGEKIVEIDITNSQPLFIVLLLKEIRQVHKIHQRECLSFNEIKKRIAGVLRRYINNRQYTTYYSNSKLYKLNINKLSFNISTILLKHSETLDFIDVLLFEKLVIEGAIYEHIGELLLEKESVWTDNDMYCAKLFNRKKGIQEVKHFTSLRKCVKTVMLNGLYSPPNTKGLKAINDLKKSFPNLFLILDAIKGNNSNDFPIYLQRMEAKFVLDICSKKISKLYPQMPLISRHDSLSTTEEYADQLHKLVQEMFCEYLGFEMRVKKEPW